MAKGVFRTFVPSSTLPPYEGTQCYWLGDAGEAILVDAGDGNPQGNQVLESAWQELGRPRVLAVFVTHYHYDHSGGAIQAAERWCCRLHLHTLDQPLWAAQSAKNPDTWEPLSPGIWTIGGVTLRVIHAPGHTPGQCNIYIPDSGVLLSGDNVLGNTTSVVAPPDGDMGQYLATLQQLLGLNPRVIGPGHGDVVHNPGAYLSQYLAHRESRSQEILRGLLQEPGTTVTQLVELIYGDTIGPRQKLAALGMIQAHLQWLIRQGLVVEDEGHFRKVAP